jgi:pimeloyl-ACP methyl ester carboxylesterase
MDLRGHGDSDTTFSAYDDVALASDMTALIQELGEPAAIIGNSMAAAAGVIVAAEHPELVRDLVLISPFVRNPKNSKFLKPILNFLTLPLWAPATFNAMLPQWFKGDKPADYAAYRQKLIASIKRPGYRTAFSRTTRTSHDPAERVIRQVSAPSLTLMGELDPDFPNATAELEWITQTLNGQGHMLANASHYPQSQQPKKVLEYVLPFMREHHSA